jgi:hypothetical protein
MSKKKKSALTDRQTKMAQGVAQGKTHKQAALDAGCSPNNIDQSAHQAMKAIQKRAPEIMDELGLNLKTLIEKYLVPELDATEVKVFNNDGEIIYSAPLVSHGARLQALDTCFKLRGDYAPKDPVLAAQIGVKVIILPKELRPDREKFYRQQEAEDPQE